MKTSIEASNKLGTRQTALTQTVHLPDYYVDLAGRMQNLADSICIKDMAGVLIPQTGMN